MWSKNSRWGRQKNGLAQRSVLAPILFNIYTKDQPANPQTRIFIYADNTTVVAQGKTFEEVEEKFTKALSELAIYCDDNNFTPDPSKSQVCAFRLRNRQAKRTKLKVTWQGQELEPCSTPKYLGWNWRELSHLNISVMTPRMKKCARNNILRKLTGTNWGAEPSHTFCVRQAFHLASLLQNILRLFGEIQAMQSMWMEQLMKPRVSYLSGCLKSTPIDKVNPLME